MKMNKKYWINYYKGSGGSLVNLKLNEIIENIASNSKWDPSTIISRKKEVPARSTELINEIQQIRTAVGNNNKKSKHTLGCNCPPFSNPIHSTSC